MSHLHLAGTCGCSHDVAYVLAHPAHMKLLSHAGKGLMAGQGLYLLLTEVGPRDPDAGQRMLGLPFFL